VPEQIAEGDLSPVRGAPVSMLRSLRYVWFCKQKRPLEAALWFRQGRMRVEKIGLLFCLATKTCRYFAFAKTWGILPFGKT
jgi:hypothetical protein